MTPNTKTDILKHFDKKASFKARRDKWNPDTEASLFRRLVHSAHKAGLDWWHIDANKGSQVRFGRKEKQATDAKAVLFRVRSGPKIGIQIQPSGWLRKQKDSPFAELIGEVKSKPLDEKIVSQFEQIFKTVKMDFKGIPLPENRERMGYWPDEIGADKELLEGNHIFYGPPGTGKTFKLSELLKDYTDEAIASDADEQRKLVIEEKIIQRTWWEAVVAALHDLESHAKVPDLEKHRYIKAFAAAKGRTQNIKQTLWSSLQLHTVNTSMTVKMKARTEPQIFDKKADSTWSLLNGWEEFCPDLAELLLGSKDEKPSPNNRYAFVTFHQSYGYEEFVEGLRPVLGEAGAEGGEVQYEIRAGVFKVLCEKARKAKKEAEAKGMSVDDIPRYAMVIDEINRGNISKIFGELITLIEDDKREGAEHAIAVTLPYSGESFSVPANVDIIGTMNTADRSLALLDTALRRRFEFVPMLPDTREKQVADDENSAPLSGLKVGQIDIRLMLETMNKRIEVLYDRDHCIGHAYFMRLEKTPTLDELGKIFKNKIIPLLEEYFFEDWSKIRLVLGDKRKPEGEQFIEETKMNDKGLTALFGANHGLDSESLAPSYQKNPAAFASAAAYTGIYSE